VVVTKRRNALRLLRPTALNLELSVEDDGVFTTPWSATLTYQPTSGEWLEYVCAQNPDELLRKSGIPVTEKPDF
jgi:hypothetical protein